MSPLPEALHYPSKHAHAIRSTHQKEVFMKTVFAFLAGLTIGAIGSAGYFYPQMQSAISKVALSEASMETLKKDAASVKATLETAAKDSMDKLAAAIVAKEAAEKAKQAAEAGMETLKKEAASVKAALEPAIKEAKDKLAAALAAKDEAEKAKQAAEKALEDAKKPAQ